MSLPNEIDQLNTFHFTRVLKGLIFVQKIILFGSRARGDFNDRSDIDLAFILSPCSSKHWQQVLDSIENADTLLKIDAVCYNDLGATSPLKKAIDAEGKTIYQKEPHGK